MTPRAAKRAKSVAANPSTLASTPSSSSSPPTAATSVPPLPAGGTGSDPDEYQDYRKRRHRSTESQRRQRINDATEQLRELFAIDGKAERALVLEKAVNKVQRLQDEMRRLAEQVQTLQQQQLASTPSQSLAPNSGIKQEEEEPATATASRLSSPLTTASESDSQVDDTVTIQPSALYDSFDPCDLTVTTSAAAQELRAGEWHPLPNALSPNPEYSSTDRGVTVCPVTGVFLHGDNRSPSTSRAPSPFHVSLEDRLGLDESDSFDVTQMELASSILAEARLQLTRANVPDPTNLESSTRSRSGQYTNTNQQTVFDGPDLRRNPDAVSCPLVQALLRRLLSEPELAAICQTVAPIDALQQRLQTTATQMRRHLIMQTKEYAALKHLLRRSSTQIVLEELSQYQRMYHPNLELQSLSNPVALCSVSSHGVMLDCNSKALKLLECRRDDVIGKLLWQLKINPDWRVRKTQSVELVTGACSTIITVERVRTLHTRSLRWVRQTLLAQDCVPPSDIGDGVYFCLAMLQPLDEAPSIGPHMVCCV